MQIRLTNSKLDRKESNINSFALSTLIIGCWLFIVVHFKRIFLLLVAIAGLHHVTVSCAAWTMTNDTQKEFKYPPFEGFIKPSDFPEKKLSGRILNAFTSVPSQIYKETQDGEWKVKHLPGNSALLSSFNYLDQETEWENHLIAWTGELKIDDKPSTSDESFYLDDAEKESIEELICKENNNQKIHPIWLLRKNQDRWRKYAENVIWPAFHYIMGSVTDGRDQTEWWYDYVKFNEAYASKIVSLYQEGDIIWIHDYYLLLLPQLIRMRLPNANVAFFLHCPFPSSEYFRAVPRRNQLLDGLLGSNKISFQNYSFTRHFLSSCKRILGVESSTPDSVTVYGQLIKVDSFSIGIDISKIEHDAFNSEIDEKVNSIKELYHNKKIIVGRDRLDSVRGVLQKLQAFEIFLEMYPEFRDNVILIQVSSPSYLHSSKIENQVSELINKINGRFGSLNSIPVHHYQMRIDKDEYLALLRVANLGLITSVRDGMNTTALEYVIAQKYNYSPLILSEFSGTTSVLKDAIIVNPWDAVAVAKAIHESLTLDDERKIHYQNKLYNDVISIQSWANNYLRTLISSLPNDNEFQNKHLTPALNRPLLYEHYKNSHRRLFLFDYDGTLTPIVKDPAAAIPSVRLMNILDLLSKDPKNSIWIISGRDQIFLEKWLGSKNPNLGLSAEHGCFMKDINSSWVNLASEFDMSWQLKVEEIFNKYTDRTPGSNIEKKKVALTWHYRRADPELGEFQSLKLIEELNNTVAKEYDVEVMSGKANVEVRPSFVNKGEIVKRLVFTKHGSPPPLHSSHLNEKYNDELPDFVVCVGDDKTDEDMFKKLLEIEDVWSKDANFTKNQQYDSSFYPVKVGPATNETFATSHLVDPNQVLETLGLLVGTVSVFQSPGTIELDDRGHVKNSESSKKSEIAIAAASKLRKNSSSL